LAMDIGDHGRPQSRLSTTVPSLRIPTGGRAINLRNSAAVLSPSAPCPRTSPPPWCGVIRAPYCSRVHWGPHRQNGGELIHCGTSRGIPDFPTRFRKEIRFRNVSKGGGAGMVIWLCLGESRQLPASERLRYDRWVMVRHPSPRIGHARLGAHCCCPAGSLPWRRRRILSASS
jgi:hypothetical protein